MVSVAEKNQRPDIPAEPEKLPGGTFGDWDAYVALIQRCWAGDLAERPTFEAIINTLRELLTASASQTRQRRLTDPTSPGVDGTSSPGGFRPKTAEDSTSPGKSPSVAASCPFTGLPECPTLLKVCLVDSVSNVSPDTLPWADETKGRLVGNTAGAHRWFDTILNIIQSLPAEPCASALSGMLGASDDLPVQPAGVSHPTIDLRDVGRLSQHPGVHNRQSDNESNESRSGFTIPIPRSEDSQGTNRSSLDFKSADFR